MESGCQPAEGLAQLLLGRIGVHAEDGVCISGHRHITARLWRVATYARIMSFEIACPSCGEDEDLAGRPGDGVIAITCGRCGLAWDRDPSPRCPTCGSTDVRAAMQAVLDKSRGTQLSIQSLRVVHLCPECDAERLADVNMTNSPLPPDELPA